jgi:hypothetical protein
VHNVRCRDDEPIGFPFIHAWLYKVPQDGRGLMSVVVVLKKPWTVVKDSGNAPFIDL